MGETHGGYVDAKSAQSVLEMLSKVLDVKINMEKLAERAKNGEQFIKKMEKEAKAQKEIANLPIGKELSYIR
jgi:proteasome assembly chaperone (PAC2) family protein